MDGGWPRQCDPRQPDCAGEDEADADRDAARLRRPDTGHLFARPSAAVRAQRSPRAQHERLSRRVADRGDSAGGELVQGSHGPELTGDCRAVDGGRGVVVRRPECDRPLHLDRRVQRGRFERAVQGRVSEAGRTGELVDSPAVDRVRHGGPADRAESEIPRVPDLDQGEAHGYRNSRRAYLAGVAAESGGVHAVAVPVKPRGRLLLAFAVAVAACLAQDRGDAVVSGIVRGAGGAPVAAATVELKNGGRTLSATTDAKGAYSFRALQTGTFTLHAA